MQQNKFKIYIYFFLIIGCLGIVTQILKSFRTDIFTDDAYYYIVVSLNSLKLGFTSFYGINSTNGFHPFLFVLERSFLNLINNNLNDPLFIYKHMVWFFSSILTFFLVIIFIYSNKKIYIEEYSVFFISILSSLSFCFIFPNLEKILFNGMESTITLPLLTLTVIYYYERKFLYFGMISSILALSRLDTILYILVPLNISIIYLLIKEKNSFNNLAGTISKIVLPAFLLISIYLIITLLIIM